MSRAAVPVTWGTATEVPVIVVYCELPMYVDNTLSPGAAMSTVVFP